jgi:hypothetical protein
VNDSSSRRHLFHVEERKTQNVFEEPHDSFPNSWTLIHRTLKMIDAREPHGLHREGGRGRGARVRVEVSPRAGNLG